jgi:hypothetical protein
VITTSNLSTALIIGGIIGVLALVYYLFSGQLTSGSSGSGSGGGTTEIFNFPSPGFPTQSFPAQSSPVTSGGQSGETNQYNASGNIIGSYATSYAGINFSAPNVINGGASGQLGSVRRLRGL